MAPLLVLPGHHVTLRAGVDIRPPYLVSAMPVSPLGPATSAPGAGGFVLPTPVLAVDVTWE